MPRRPLAPRHRRQQGLSLRTARPQITPENTPGQGNRLRLDGRLTGHYTRFRITSGLPVIRQQL